MLPVTVSVRAHGGKSRFSLRGSVRSGFALGRDKENRVIAKAAVAASRVITPASCRGRRLGLVFRMTHINQHAVELRLTLFVRNVFQGNKQFFQILLVRASTPE
jgi:hypothetical protein